uniref:CHRD domain-containing protein n=1 Tax=Roseiarcus sp. TaxID=1969460 RepID=UPI003F9B6483
ADLTGPAETPPTDSKGTGTLAATYDNATKTLTWTVDYSGLTGPVIAAHFHGPAPVGKPAPIEVPLKAPLDSPMKGSATLTDAQAKDLMDGMMYFNIHTAEHKPGEIRGQLEKAM